MPRAIAELVSDEETMYIARRILADHRKANHDVAMARPLDEVVDSFLGGLKALPIVSDAVADEVGVAEQHRFSVRIQGVSEPLTISVTERELRSNLFPAGAMESLAAVKVDLATLMPLPR